MKIQTIKPVLLTVTAGVGIVTTAILAARGHLKAVQEGGEVPHDDNRVRYGLLWMQTNWRFYAPATVSAILTISALIGSHKILSSRNALAVGGLISANRELGVLRKSIEDLPEEAQATVRNRVQAIKQRREEVENAPSAETIVVSEGDILWKDEFSGRYFTASQNDVHAAVNEVNRDLNLGDSVALNTFYSKIGLPHTQMGEILGWPVMSDLVEIAVTGDVAPDMRPCLNLTFVTPPIESFDRVWR